MSTKKMLVLLGVLLLGAVVFTACAGPAGPEGPAGPAGPAGPQGPAGADAAPLMASDLSCTECHNDTSLITEKAFAWEESKHGIGEAALYAGGREGCTGCHSGASFTAMVAAGETNPDTFEGVAGVTRQDCRACHQIHTSYTGDDWALTTTESFDLYATEGVTFDGGKGNLCARCHQARRAFPAAENGVITGISSHWGPHHGPQASMLMGVAGAGAEGKPSSHATLVEDTCVSCHVGESANHGFEPDVANCQGCHADIEDFDFSGLQTKVQAQLDQIGEALVAEGVLSDTTVDGHPTVTEAPENVAIALYNWIYIAHEDKSLGVHNPAYTQSLLDASFEALGITPAE